MAARQLPPMLLPADNPVLAPPMLPALEISVQEPGSGRVLAQFVLRLTPAAETIGPMTLCTPAVSKDASASPVKDAISPKIVTKLINDWGRYLKLQQAYSDEHVSRSKTAAEEWSKWANKNGWTLPSAMKWVQSILGKKARKTAQNKASQAREFCQFAISMGKLEANPFTGVKVANGRRDRRRQWAPFEVGEVRKLIDAAEAREASSDKRRSKNGPLASTFYAFLTLTGLRKKEATLQLWSDIDLQAATMVVTVDKAQRQDMLPLCTEAVAVLRAWKKYSPGERLFPKAPSAHTLRSDMESAGIKRSSDGGKKGEWHRFRKTAISERAGAGADVRNLHHFARHENLQTTLSLYDRAKVEQLRDVAALMPRLNGFLKRERADPGRESPFMKKNPHNDLTSALQPAEDVGVQGSPSVASKAPPHPDDSDHRQATAEPEHFGVNRRDGRLRQDVKVACSAQEAEVEWSRGELNPSPVTVSTPLLRVCSWL